jgi:hypothetical protein
MAESFSVLKNEWLHRFVFTTRAKAGPAGVAHDTVRFRTFADKAEGRFRSVGSGLRVTDVRASGVSCSSTEPSTCSGSRP